MAAYLDGFLQGALDMEEKPALRVCQAIGLPTVPAEAPAPQGEDANGPKRAK